MMEMNEIKSSNIASQGYDPDTKTLRVEFKNGGTYDYHGVSQEDHDGLMEADSFGSRLNSVKGNFKFSKQ